MIYVIGSLKHQRAREVAHRLRAEGYDVFDDWQAGSPDNDKYITKYERERGRNLRQALQGLAIQNMFQFDKKHLCLCCGAVMVMPAGKSAHAELGFMCGLGKPVFILFDKDPEEFDLMYAFATDVCYDMEELIVAMRKAGMDG